VTGYDDLYQEIILDHYRSPRNTAVLDDVPEAMVHENPSCGDSLKLEVVVRDGVVDRVRFDGRGCAISTASASLMTEQVRGKTVAEAREMAQGFIRAMRGESSPESLDAMEDLAAFKGVIRLPVRVKCATLAWHAFLSSLPKEV
jgi:nitrogen fixation protein NifU and related proteins